MARTYDKASEPRGVKGWLLVLCVLLVAWGPLELAVVVASALPALSVRGVSLGLILIVRILVTAFGMAAGFALLSRRSAAPAMARAAIILSAAADTFVYLTPYMPNNRMPGDTPFYIAADLAYWCVWYVYLIRSRRVHNTYG
jgi:hypothetical protein